ALERVFDGAPSRVEDGAARPAPDGLLLAPVRVVEADDEGQPGLGRRVEHVFGRQGVDADGVQPGRGYCAEVLDDARRLRVELAVARARREGAVRRAAEPEGSDVEGEERPVGPDAC